MLRVVVLALVAILLPALSHAQDGETPGAAETESKQLLSPAELDQLVAPIALYPDALLAQVLMASTYPLEVVQAERWAKVNKKLKGDALTKAAAKQDWDDSIKALVAAPSILATMNEKLDWTMALGDAVLAQQADVMDAVQRLRSLAANTGKLETTEQQKVSVVQEASKEVVVIESASPDVVYVPYYDPTVVYGTWPYPDYPPYYYPPAAGWVVGGAIAAGIVWGIANDIGDWDEIDWNNGNINIDIDRNTNIDIDRDKINRGKWEHSAHHRRGVNYTNKDVRNKFAKASPAAGDRKLDYRGHNGKPVLDAGKKPDLGGEGPDLGAKKPDLADKGPGDRKQDLGKGPGKQADLGKGPGKKPNLGKPAAKKSPPGGKLDLSLQPELFDYTDGARAKDFAKRGQASLGDRSPSHLKPSGAGRPGGGYGAAHFGGGGSRGHVSRGGGGRGGGGRGGGRRSDIQLKEDIVPLNHLGNGLGLYRFRYRGSDRTLYVGVMAQEVQEIDPKAVWRDRDGYLRVDYERIGVNFMTWDEWVRQTAAKGGRQ